MDHVDAAAIPVSPLERLDEAAMDAVHDASMQIIEDIGIQLNHERARERLVSAGATHEGDGVLTVPRDVVEERVRMAPSSFVLHARNPDNDVEVGGDGGPVRAPSQGPGTIWTLADGRRQSRLADYERLLKLAQAEDVVTCTGYGLCEPTDLDPATEHYELLERALTLTDQPIMGPTYGASQACACMDMVGIAVGDEDLSKPYVAGLVNTIPPRRLGEEMLGALLTYAEHGQPLVVSSFTMAGASGPGTLASSLALTNAENLIGITLAQAVNPGTPVVYGVPTATVDDRYGSLSIGGPESALFAAFAGQMGRYYDVPSRGGGGLTDAKRVDYQSGFESTLLQAVTHFSGVDFVLHATGVLESYSTISPEKFVLDCEVIRSLDRFGDGFDIEDSDFRLDQLAAVDPGGHFLEDEESSDPVYEFYRPSVVDKRSYDAWDRDGAKSAVEMGADRVDAILDDYEAPALPDDVARDLEAYVESHRPTSA